MTEQVVTLRLTANAQGLIAGVQLAKRETDSFGGSVERTGRQVSAGMGAATNTLRNFAVQAAAAFSVRAMVRMADEYSNLRARLSLVTGSQAELAAAMDQTYAIAQRTSTGLASTAELYGRMQKSADSLGRSQSDALRVTDLINKSFQVSGTAAGTANAAIIQLAQGLGAGALRGDEFNSVLEGSPRLAQALTDSLGVNVGQLRKMAEAGELTAETIINALMKQGDVIGAEFAQLPLTVGRAWTQIENAALAAIGKIDSVLGGSGALAAGLQALVGYIEKIPRALSLWVEAFDGAGAAFDLLLGPASDVVSKITDEFLILPVSLRTAVTIIIGELDQLRISAVEKFDLLVIAGERAWLALEASASGLAGELEVLLGGAIDMVARKYAELIDGLADSASTLGMDSIATSLRAMSSEIQTAANYEKTIRAEVESSAAAYRAKGAALEAASASITDAAAQEIAASQGAVAASLAERDAALLQINTQEDLAAASTATSAAIVAANKATGLSTKEVAKATKEQADAIRTLQDMVEGYAYQLAGTVDQAWMEYEAAVREANAAADAAIDISRTLGEAGEDEARILALQEAAIDGATQARDRAIAAAKRQADVFGRLLTDLDQEVRLSGMTTQQRRIEEIVLRAVAYAQAEANRQQNQSIALDSAEQASLRGVVAVRLNEIDALDQVRQAQEDYENTVIQGSRSMAQATGDWVASGLRDTRRFVDSVKDTFKRMFADLVAQAAQSGFMKLLGGIFGLGGSAGAFAGTGQSGGGLLANLFGGGGGAGLMQYAPALAALAGGAFGLTNRGSSTGSAGSIGASGAYGYAGYAAGTVAYGAALGASGAVAGGASAAAGAASGAIGAAGAIPVVGWIVAAIAAIDMITGGKVFGTRYRAESGTTSLNIGADGGDASQTIREVRQRALFGGRQWRNRSVDASDEATEAALQLFDSVRGVMTDAARALKGDAPAMIDAALRTVVEYDKKGKVKAVKYFVDLMGRTWEEETAEAATQRIMAESMIATIDSILGTTADAAGQSAADAAGTVIDAAAGAAGDAVGQAGASVFDTLIRKVGDAQGEASTIAERWRDDAALLMDGAQMLLAAAVDIRKGNGLLGDDGTLTQIADLIEELQAPGEALAATYQRVAASAALFDEMLTLSGVSIDKTREQLVRFSVDAAEAAGGLDRLRQLSSSYVDSFFTAAERAEYARNQAQDRAASQAGDIGLNLSDFTGTGGMQAFRDLFESQMPTLTADAYVQWLEFAEALAFFVGLSGDATDAIAGVSGSLAELMASVTEQLEQYAPPQTFAQRLQAINVETDTMIAQARALGATEEQLGQIRALSAARLGEVLDEQAAAMADYQSMVQGINDELADARGLSEFQREMREINRWFADTTASLNEAARAAGLQGAAEQDLAAVHELAAIRAAQAIARLEESGRGLVEQLYGTPLERLNNELENMWNGIGGMNASTAAGMNQVTEATDNAIQAQIGAQQRIRDWLDGLMASDLGGLRPRDAMAEAQALFDRTLEAALGGDADAMGQLPQLADQLLRLGQRVYASGDPYFDLRDAIRAALEQVAAINPVDPTGNTDSGPTLAQQVASVQGPFGGNFFGDAGPAATSAAALDARAAAERRVLANELAGVIRDLVTSTGRPLDEIEETLGFSMADLVADLGVNLNELTAATATQLADIAQSTGTELSALAASVGVDLGSLADRQSMLNDALEAEVSALPPEQAAELEPMLRAIEDAAALGDTEGVEEGIAEMEAAINGMSPAIRDALAPYFEGIRPPDPSTQIGLLGSISGELASHTGLLAGILAGIGSLGSLNEPAAPSPWVGPLTPGGTLGGPPGYAVGTSYVPADGLAYLHRGEAVFPASVSEFFRREGIPIRPVPVLGGASSGQSGAGNDALIAELRELRRERREADEYTKRLEQRVQQLETTTARGDDAKVRALDRQTDVMKSGTRR